MRLFIAITLPDDIKDILYNIQKEIGNEYVKVKWVARKNVHLTLKFLGDVDGSKVEIIKEALRNVNHKKFKLSLGNLGWYPSKDKVNVIWVGLRPEKEVFHLHSEVELKLGSLFGNDSRFGVHMTLGRVKFVKYKEKFLDLLKKIKIRGEDFEVNSFSLIKSDLSKDGPKYFVMEKYELQ